MRHSRRRTRVAALGAAAAVVLSGLGLFAPGAALAMAPLPAPSGLAPNSAFAVKNVELTWSAVAGATSYELRMTDADDTTVTTVTSVPRYTLPTSAPRGEYEWSVRARTSSGWGPWSAPASLVHGWTGRPTNLRSTAGLVPTYSWDPVPDASFYEVEVSDSPFAEYPEAQSGKTKHWICYTTQTTLAPYGISAGADKDPAPGKGDCAFTSDPEGDATTESLGTQYIQGQTYYWRVRGRDGTVDTRQIGFADPAVGCTGVWNDSGAFDEMGEDGKPTGKVVIPIGQKPPGYLPTPECSEWAVGGRVDVPRFTPVAPLGQPEELKVSPTPEGFSTEPDVTVSGSPVFSWKPVSGAFKYRVYLSRTRDFLDSDVIWETQANTLAPVSDLSLSTTGKYWTVQACLMQCGPPAPAHRVRKDSKSTTEPAALKVAADGKTLTASWSVQDPGVRGTGLVAPRTAAKYYDVRFTNADTGDEVKVVSTDRIASAAEAGLSHLVVDSTAFPEGRYTFAVRGISETGRALPWSGESASVLIDRTAPTVRLTSRSGFAERQPVRLSFTEAVSRVTSATLGVRGSDGKVVAGTIRAVSPATYDFTPSAPWVTGLYVEAWTRGVVDRAGRAAVTTATTTQLRASTTADSTSTSLTYGSGDRSWSTRTSSAAYGKSYRSTRDDARTSRRAYVAATVYGTSLTVGTCKSPTSGSLQVWVDGKLRTTEKLYRSYTGCGTTVTVKGLSAARHAVKLVAVANGSRGDVAVDRLTVA